MTTGTTMEMRERLKQTNETEATMENAATTRHDAWCACTLCIVSRQEGIDRAVMARLRAPFGCELVGGRWRIHDANDDAIASCAPAEEGYARLIVQSLNEQVKCARRIEQCHTCRN